MPLSRTCARYTLAAALAIFATPATVAIADAISVHHTQGAVHGFLVLRSQAGATLGYGEFTQLAEGDRVTAHLVYRFRDGSLDDETTVFTQRGTFQLVSDHHVQRGPFFPKPSDITVEANGQVTLRTAGKDGKPEVQASHIDLPSDVSNGMVGTLLANIAANSPGFKLSLVVPYGKGRLIGLAGASAGQASFTVAGATRKAAVFRIKLQVGGVAGMLAPAVGKQPPDVLMWILEGEAPIAVREIGQLSEDGPVISVELAGATFPKFAAPAPAKSK